MSKQNTEKTGAKTAPGVGATLRSVDPLRVLAAVSSESGAGFEQHDGRDFVGGGGDGKGPESWGPIKFVRMEQNVFSERGRSVSMILGAGGPVALTGFSNETGF